MYAIVEVGGMQFKVSKQDVIRVPKIQEEAGKGIDMNVLLVVDKDQIHVGRPLVDHAIVKAVVLAHGKAKKIKVFKKKRRKDTKVLKGHRQDYTELRIDQITLGSDKKKAAAPEGKIKTETKAETKEQAIKKPELKSDQTEKTKAGKKAEIQKRIKSPESDSKSEKKTTPSSKKTSPKIKTTSKAVKPKTDSKTKKVSSDKDMKDTTKKK